MGAEAIRCQNDLGLYHKLLEHPDIIKTNEHLDQLAEKGGVGIRRHLLANSVRLSSEMAGHVHAAAERCKDKLEIEIQIELYVFPSPQFNAACFKPEDGRLFVMFSSSLLESFDDTELRFVMGHELGHHVYRHHDIPIGYILRGGTRPDVGLALDLFAWSRYAEISADRAGAHCADDLDAVARALFKLASGLSGATIEFNLEAFLSQVDEMQIVAAEPGQGAPKEDWFSTHPFSPLRVKALQLFHQSVFAQPGGMNRDDLEVAVQRLMSLMEPGYMEGKTKSAEAMRRALFAATLTVAAANDDISEPEIQVFERFFGKGSFTDKLSLDKLRQELPVRLQQVRDLTSVPQRMQLMHDLCIIARAEGYVTEVERAALNQIADGLEVPHQFICQTLDADPELD